MTEIVDPISFLEKKLKEMRHEIYPEQETMIGPMFEALQRKGIVFVGQGPTGMGKTYVIAAVTFALRNLKKRVCIAVPSYTHLKEVMGKHLNNLDIEFVKLRGRTALEKHEGCPLKNMLLPSAIFCSDGRNAETGPESEKCSNIDCVVRREKQAVEESNVVVTVFHKLLSNPQYMNKFDAVIFDESHGLEPVVRHTRVVRIRQEELRILANFAPEYKDVFEKVISDINPFTSRGSREIPLRFIERYIVDPLDGTILEIKEKIRTIEVKGGICESEVVNAFFRLQSAIEAFKRPGEFRFINHQGIILGVPHTIYFAPQLGRKFTKNNAIALISATIENPKFHAKDSGFPYHALAPPIQVKTTSFFELFKRRPIFGLLDGPILKKDLSRLDEYELARGEANEVIESFLPEFDYPVLILCRSHSDAQRVQAHLETIPSIKERLLVFDKEESLEDVDKIETTVNERIESGKNIVLTSASSRLWEGVNLIGLKMLIIDALPYASPQPYDFLERKAWGSWKTSRTFRFMIRRIQQGIGRLIRTKDDLWGIVVVVDARLNAQWGTISSVLPDYLTNPEITKFVTRSELPRFVKETAQKLALLKPINQ